MQSMLLLLRHLSDHDKLGIVIFDSDAHVLAPLTTCDSEGRDDLEQALGRVQLRGGTNLSGGLYRALELHACAGSSQSRADGAGIVRSTLLFTDGEANRGITEQRQLLGGMRSLLQACPEHCTVTALGFGTSHCATLLQSIATAGTGSYCFVESEEKIAETFGSMLGGLLTLVHQNVRMVLKLDRDVQIQRLWTTFPWKLGRAYTLEKRAEVLIDLGDMYAEERRDILVSFALPKVPAAGTYSFSTFQLQGFSVLALGPERSQTLSLSVERDEAVLDTMAPDPFVLRQQSRHITALALAAAQKSGQAGKLHGARCGLIAAAGVLSDTSLAKTGDSFSLGLLRDLNECYGELMSMGAYRSTGSKRLATMHDAHAAQRSCGSQGATQTYATPTVTSTAEYFSSTISR